MKPRAFVTFAGFILLIAGIFSPLISPLGLIKWSLFDLNRVFAIVVLVIAIIGLAGTLIKNNQLAKITAWISLALVVLVYIAAVMKVKTTFSFIPFPKLSQTLSGFIHYRWGWYLLFFGPILALLGSVNRKSIHPSNK
ncbi:hypothetical protein [Mucilaginibacter arboris]|uniref:Uncharacterized protein n=1 Tax=Mucilaginibacter arboris TaxID=2682090 RepID=A0A7K1T031_9SPHI|nr:hypothetical protein [Mucilaginibacter arboris]MVN22922.1 hypothetical protein [Mucilaginibacter arboris]